MAAIKHQDSCAGAAVFGVVHMQILVFKLDRELNAVTAHR
jgi:hypothetical protein